jgi:hypothetical protein
MSAGLETNDHVVKNYGRCTISLVLNKYRQQHLISDQISSFGNQISFQNK